MTAVCRDERSGHVGHVAVRRFLPVPPAVAWARLVCGSRLLFGSRGAWGASFPFLPTLPLRQRPGAAYQPGFTCVVCLSQRT